MKSRLKLHFLVSTLAVLALGFLALPALAAPGDVDPAFNGGRPAVIDSNPTVSITPYAAAMNPLNGDILWAGYYVDSTSWGGTIAAYKPDGSLDTTVNGNGEILLDPAQAGFPGGYLFLFAIAVDSQGRILAAGFVTNAIFTTITDDMVLARFKPDGTLDTGFGAAGTGIVVAPLNTWAIGTGLSLTADGHILVTGQASDGGTAYPLTVWRFNPDGTPDTGYGSNGLVQIAAIDDSAGFLCFPALQPDGALIAGCDRVAGSWKLTRLKADGAVDTGFGTGGYLTGIANWSLAGLALAPDGGFVISELDTTSDLDMRRFLADGTVDTGFNGGSPLALGTVPSGVEQVPVAVQPDSKILLSVNGGGSGNDLAIVRFLADGTADAGFTNIGTPGLSLIDFTNIGNQSYTPYATALLLQGDGRIVASGWADSTAGSGEAGFVTRVLSDTYDLTPTAPAFNAVAHAPLGQAIASNAVAVGGVSIGSATSGFSLALNTLNGKYSTNGGASFAGGFTGTNLAWAPAGSSLALEQMTPTTGGTDTTTSVILGGFWAANNYEVPLGSPATASWTTTTDQPPVASDGTLIATTGKATTGTLSATNPSSGTLVFAIVTAAAHGTATITNAATGAYTYTSAGGYTGADSFTWKVNDGVADSNAATVNITVNAAPPPPPPPPPSGGGGGFGPLALLGLLFLTLVPWWLRRRGLRSTSTRPTEDIPMKPHRARDSIGLNLQDTQLREDIPMKPHLKLHFLVSTLAVLALGFLALPALAATWPGYIDTTFNGGVPAVIDSNPSSSIDPFAAAMNPLNGDILWAGDYQDSTTLDGAIAAYKPDGSLNPAVGGGSGEIALTPAQAGVSGGNLYWDAIAVDGQGRILAAGEIWNASLDDMILARFKPDGSLDPAFGAAGTGIVVAPLNTWAAGTGLSLTADGHILVTGEADNAGNTAYPLTVWQFKSDGTPDTAFGSNGLVQIAAINAAWPCFPALQPDGALIVGCPTAGGSWKLTRLKADGAVDTGFGTGGYLTGIANWSLAGLALAPDGGFVISELDTTSDLDMRRFLADGSVDPGFNSGNPLALGTVPSGTWQVPVAVQPDGKILLSVNDGGPGLFILRFLADGSVDTDFGNAGPGGSDIDFASIGGFDYTPNATALLVQGDGRIVISGWAGSTAGPNDAAFVTRVLSDTYDLTPTAPAFTAVTRAPLGQAVASNAVAVGGETIGGGSSGVNVALVTLNGKYNISGAPFAGSFTATNAAWAPAEGSLALEQMTPTTGGTDTTTTVVLGGFWAANNYEIPLGSPPTAFWTTTTDQPPVASDGTLIATTGKATTGTLSATNPSSGTLVFAIVTPPAHGSAVITNAATGAYNYTSAGGYTGSDAFTWKVNDGVADSNTATVNVTVKKAPPSGGGGGFGALGLLALALLGFGAMFRKRRES